jgi:hypothetical protein
MCYIPCPFQSSWFTHSNDICWVVQSIKLLVIWYYMTVIVKLNTTIKNSYVIVTCISHIYS